MRSVVVAAVTRGSCALPVLFVLGLLGIIPMAQSALLEPELLTNLFQLRQSADEEPPVVHSFRIVAEVCDVDPTCGMLVLRDASGAEFIRLDLPDQRIEPGTTVCFEGEGCAFKRIGFGLTVIPRLLVDNDGRHGVEVASGTKFLHAGINPITVQWFNGIGDLALNVEYEGPDLPRQRIPNSVLSRAVKDATGATHFSAGLDFRCYEGAWESVPDFSKFRAANTGIATNFGLGVRTRSEGVGLEFNGFITIPRAGTYTFYVASDDGSRLFVGPSSTDLRVLDSHPISSTAEGFPTTEAERNNHPWLTLEGVVDFAGIRGAGGELHMKVGSDDIRVEVLESQSTAPSFPGQARVRASGIYQEVVTEDGSRVPGVLRVSSWKSVRPVSESSTPMIGDGQPSKQSVSRTDSVAGISPITTVAEIKALASEVAKQQLPVSIRGVVTATLPASRGAVVQDSTKGIFIALGEFRKAEPLQLGEFCQIDGVTSPGLFAPLVLARRITHLGVGRLPQPVYATWDQMMNGSLDTQYAEIQGVATAVRNQQLAILMEGGKVTLDVSELKPEVLASYENALIRIRGCVIGPFNAQTHKVEPGPLRVGAATVCVVQAAPRDLFDAPRKSIEEVLLYDAKATPFRLLKVNGQVIYCRPGEYFLSDGTNGMHVTTRNSDVLTFGDLVDAVGFLELGGPAVELKEAVLRKTGSAPLPVPTKLASEHLLLANHADTLVKVDATLMNQWREGSERVLELQSGFVAFRARLNTAMRSPPLPRSGSRLELTGVYEPQGIRAGDGTVTGFELLLHKPTDIRVLAKPPWWTLKLVLLLSGVLAALLCVVLLWNKQLRWQVQERTRKLEIEISHRERAEQQRTAEAERSRIARDLHDELGAGLTEVSLLASAGRGELRPAERDDDRFRVIAEKARSLVSGLDVIVWAVDPRRNSLQSFADYIGSYAREFLSVSDIACRLKIPIECDPVTLTGASRHSLFLAVKEALNNIVRHASATEVELQISLVGDHLQIIIDDNGCGFDGKLIRRGNGLANIEERLRAMHGEFQIASPPGMGTTIKLTVPLPARSE